VITGTHSTRQELRFTMWQELNRFYEQVRRRGREDGTRKCLISNSKDDSSNCICQRYMETQHQWIKRRGCYSITSRRREGTHMQDNIATMFKNTESAESMTLQSEQLNEQASVFTKNEVRI